MASRRFLAYDPYDYHHHYTNPYQHGYPYYYYQQHPASARGGVNDAYVPGVWYDAEASARQRQPTSPAVTTIPVRFVGSEPDRHREPAREELHAPTVARSMVAAAAPARNKRARLMEGDAAVRVQAAARGFLARRMVREVRAVEREAGAIAARMAAEVEALRGDERGRVAVGEALMRLLLRLDAVRGAREYRRKVTKKVLALQDAVDALEPRSAASAAVEMAEGAALAVDMEAKETAVEMGAEEATGGHDAADADHKMDDGEKQDAVEGEWEMVTAETEACSNAESAEAVDAGPASPEEKENAANGGAAAGDGAQKKPTQGIAADVLDARKVMQMVAALCERSAQQCEVIGALARRVDSLERVVRRVEDAERRRRRSKKLKKDGKGSTKSAARSCYSD